VLDVSKYFRNTQNVVELDAGERLFSQGDPGDTMYAILDGELAIEVDGTTVDRISTGRLLGETAIIESAPRGATVVAVSTCRLAVVDRAHFLFMVHEAPTFALDVMREMAERLRHARGGAVSG
jgi:CRP-like cAMP-binding protein